MLGICNLNLYRKYIFLTYFDAHNTYNIPSDYEQYVYKLECVLDNLRDLTIVMRNAQQKASIGFHFVPSAYHAK